MGQRDRAKAKAELKAAKQERVAMARGLTRIRAMRMSQEADHRARATVAAIRRAKAE